jgi:hypothetical protein
MNGRLEARGFSGIEDEKYLMTLIAWTQMNTWDTRPGGASSSANTIFKYRLA